MNWRDTCTTCGRGHSYYGSCRPVFDVSQVDGKFDVIETAEIPGEPSWKRTDIRTIASCTSEEAAKAIRRLIVCTSPPMPG